MLATYFAEFEVHALRVLWMFLIRSPQWHLEGAQKHDAGRPCTDNFLWNFLLSAVPLWNDQYLPDRYHIRNIESRYVEE